MSKQHSSHSSTDCDKWLSAKEKKVLKFNKQLKTLRFKTNIHLTQTSPISKIRRKQAKITSFIRNDSNTKRTNQRNNSDDCVIVASTESVVKSRPFEFDISDTEEMDESCEKLQEKAPEDRVIRLLEVKNEEISNVIKENYQREKSLNSTEECLSTQDNNTYTFHEPNIDDLDEFTFHSGYRGYTLSDD
ncbi:DgyrCDS5353 [Dimorphilus gyrociliatus]|uniref:DgyrCDS5353 n=1 Tax=Dimorphilus gyrociliatus TaxID=2664684 RepID=A0A7I8VPH1_9ANNE|nr:DgyrCDS5353 [Dimorphilus gyrociliatus]